MTDNQPTTRRIETQIDIHAPVDAVWKALTDAEELCNWFPPFAEVKPGKGGHIRVVWGEKQDWTSPIGEWEPNKHLQVIWSEPTPPEKAEQARKDGFFIPFRIAVDYYLEARGSQTRLRLVHSGFSADAVWDNQYDGTERGWAFELRGLKHYLESHRGTKRVVVHAKRTINDIAIDEAWQRLMGPEALLADGKLASRRPGDRYAITTITADHLEGAVQILNPPKDFCGTAENFNNAFLRVRIDESCMGQPGREVNLWLSTYGLPADQTDALQKRWQTMLDDVFSTVPSK